MSLIDKQLRQISGAKDKSGVMPGSVQEAPDTLRSDTIVNLIEAVSEGPIVGLVNGANSVYINGTPILNADGTHNYVGIEVDQRTGTPDQTPLPGPAQTATLITVETQVKHVAPVIRTIEDDQVTAAQLIIRIPSLASVNQTDGTVNAYSVSFQIDRRASGGDWVTQFVCNLINQKVTSPYKKQFVVQAPGDGQPWDIRVVRISVDQDPVQAQLNQNETWWESYSELTAGAYTYDDTALVSLFVDAFTFGSQMGQRLYDVRGLIIDVPANYDPTTRAYTGIWDGTFKAAYTNNPAWVFWDLLTNARYGLGEFVDPQLADKWTLFTIAQYCDQLVPSGFKNAADNTDIMEPRYTFNGVINNRQEAYKVLQDIAATFRGMAFWSLGQVFAAADMPSDPVASFSPANVIGGHFTYSGTAMKSRHSVAVVQWNDPTNYFRTTPEIVQDHDMIRQFGWRQTDVKLIGCTSRGQALRFGKWILDSEKNQTETVQFSISWDNYVLVGNQALRPGQIIMIADPRKNGNFRTGGRLAQVNSTTSMVMDQPFVPESGQSYTISALLPNGTFETHPISSFGSDNKTLTLGAAFTEAPVHLADFLIQATDLVARQYRVLSVQEAGENTFKVTALAHDPNKYARVENGVKFDPIPYVRPKNTINQVTNLQASETNYFQDGVSHSRVTLGWTGPSDFSVQDYLVTANTPHGFIAYPATKMPALDINDAAGGDWVFYVIVRSLTGVTSPAASVSLTVRGWQAVNGPTPTALRTSEGGSEFTGVAPTILWTNQFPPDYVQYNVTNVVRVYDSLSNLLRTERVQIPQYTYDYAKNVNDGGPRRDLRFDITALNVTGVESPIASLEVSNPPPPAQVPTLHDDVGTIDVSWLKQVSDYAGAYVWFSTNSGFVPDLTNWIYNGPDTKTILTIVTSGNQYVWLGIYDAFGTDGMLISSPATLDVNNLTDTLAQVVPDLVAAEITVETENIGDQIAGILNQIIQDRDWNDQLHARQEQTLSVKSDNLSTSLSAMVTQEQTARIEADFAEATLRSALEASLNASIIAQITTEQTARVSADNAMTTQISAAQSSIAGNTAAISSEAITRASADSALTTQITSALSSIAGNTASIATEASTRATADSANAAAITSLSTTVGTNTASISTVQTSINGVEVQFGVIGTVDGVTGGFLMTGIKKIDGSVSYTLEIQGNVIVDGTIAAAKLNVTSLSAISANVGTITAGILRSTDSFMVFDLGAKTITISDSS